MKGITKCFELPAFAYFGLIMISIQVQAQTLDTYDANKDRIVMQDWLINPTVAKAKRLKSRDEKDLILDNSLLRRVFRLSPIVECYEFRSLTAGRLLRTIKEEARLVTDGNTSAIGSLDAESEQSYLTMSVFEGLKPYGSTFQYVFYCVKAISLGLKLGEFTELSTSSVLK